MSNTASSRMRPSSWARSDEETRRRPSSPFSPSSIPNELFTSPAAAGRKITAGFSYVQRIGKSGCADVWFPDQMRNELETLVEKGTTLGPEHFPSEWAAVRQFELLQESGNYKVFDMRADYITRTLRDLASHMRGGGYRMTVATIGRYVEPKDTDDLAILDKRLQARIARLTHMMYLDEQSEAINQTMDKALAEESWNFQTALPHIGVTLGARDLFRPAESHVKREKETVIVPCSPYRVQAAYAAAWIDDIGVTDAATGQRFACVNATPQSGQYQIKAGHYLFAAADTGREVILGYTHSGKIAGGPSKLSAADRKHKLAKTFFNIINQLPQEHIVHDTAVGLQIPESINENEWIYVTEGEDTLWGFNNLLTDLFRPFDGVSLSRLDGRADATTETKGTVQHMRSYGDRLTPEADQYYRNLSRYTM